MNNQNKICRYCKSEINLSAKKCPHCQSDLRNWFVRHWIISILLFVFIVIPVLIGIFVPDDFVGNTNNIANVENNKAEEKTLTEKLKEEIDNWDTAEAEDYSTIDDIEIQETLFTSYAYNINQGENSTSTEDNKLASELKTKLIAKQLKEYPKMRKAYAEYLKDYLWENDIDVTISGKTLTLVGAIFAANKNKGDMQAVISRMVNNLRFKRVNYKWIEHDTKYTYYDVDSLNDGDLKYSEDTN